MLGAASLLQRLAGTAGKCRLTPLVGNCFSNGKKKAFWLFQQVYIFFSHKKGASKQPLSGDHILSSCKQEAPSSKEILIAARCNDAPIEQ